MMKEAELPDRPVINDSPVRKDIVPIPLHPAENILAFKLSGCFRERFGCPLKHLPVFFFGIPDFGPLPVFDLSCDMVVNSPLQSGIVPLLEIAEKVGGTQKVLPHTDGDAAPVVIRDHRQYPFSP